MKDPFDSSTIDFDQGDTRRIQLGMATTGKTDYGTPAALYRALDRQFNFTVDLAADSHNHKHAIWYGPDSPVCITDALAVPWGGRGFLNPPFGRGIHRWIRKAVSSIRGDAELVCMLLPASFVGWWWQYVAPHANVSLLQHRVRYDGAPHTANFDTAIALFSENPIWERTFPSVGTPTLFLQRICHEKDG